MKTDLDRKVNAHVTFGLGPHRCIGSHLAKAEVIVALRSGLPRIEEFRIDEGQPIEIFAVPVMGFRSLPLVWSRRRRRSVYVAACGVHCSRPRYSRHP